MNCSSIYNWSGYRGEHVEPAVATLAAAFLFAYKRLCSVAMSSIWKLFFTLYVLHLHMYVIEMLLCSHLSNDHLLQQHLWPLHVCHFVYKWSYVANRLFFYINIVLYPCTCREHALQKKLLCLYISAAMQNRTCCSHLFNILSAHFNISCFSQLW